MYIELALILGIALQLMKHLHLNFDMGKKADTLLNKLFLLPKQCPEKKGLDTELQALKK